LGSRIRTRLQHEAATRDELMALLKYLIHTAGAPKLMTAELMSAICDHSLGTPRVMLQMSNELLAAAAHREAAQLDEKLYLEVFDPAKISKASGARERSRVARGQ
jgi:type II secretory pathway predicted ATPase ExeA